MIHHPPRRTGPHDGLGDDLVGVASIHHVSMLNRLDHCSRTTSDIKVRAGLRGQRVSAGEAQGSRGADAPGEEIEVPSNLIFDFVMGSKQNLSDPTSNKFIKIYFGIALLILLISYSRKPNFLKSKCLTA